MQRGRFKIILILVLLLAAMLRIPYLAQFPPSLYSDEVDQGYNAYSILKTGRDEHGVFLPVSLRSFGDWKPPLQTYLAIPTIAIFGLNEWGIRLPSALLGTLTILFVYLITKQLLILTLVKNKSHEKIALIAAFLVAISPWHILESRSAMLVCVALFFLCVFMWSFLMSISKPRYLYISALAWGLSIYAYYGMRLIMPLLIVGLFFFLRKKLSRSYTYWIGSALLLIILLLPLGVAFFNNPDVVFGRARTVSIFHDQGVPLTIWELIAQDGPKMPHLLAQFFHNKPYYYTLEILRRFFEHADGRFLFLVGDQNPPFQIPNMGVLYFLEALLLPLGLVLSFRKNRSLTVFLLFFISISILPAALTYVTPASNRTFSMVIPLMILISFAISFLAQKKIIKWLLPLVYGLSFGFFLFQFTLILPKSYPEWWHGGYKELMLYLESEEKSYDTIAISGKASMPYIFLFFYQRVDPRVAQAKLNWDYNEDQFGFEHGASFGKYQFIRHFEWGVDGERLLPGTLLVVTGEEVVDKQTQKIHEIVNPLGKPFFKIYKI